MAVRAGQMTMGTADAHRGLQGMSWLAPVALEVCSGDWYRPASAAAPSCAGFVTDVRCRRLGSEVLAKPGPLHSN
jgi:hypothetical protein